MGERRLRRWRRAARARALEAATGAARFVPHALLEGSLALAAPLARWTRPERTTRANLELALGGETDAVERARIARGVRRHAARQAASWLRLAGSGPAGSARGAWIEERVALDPSVEHLDRELSRGRGALVVTAHIGDWELLAARLWRAGRRGAVVGYRRPSDPSSAWLERLRSAYGVRTIPQSAHPREILAVLARGEIVGLLCDLDVRRIDGEFVPFFGRPALTMTAPAALARAARAPLVPTRCTLDGERYVLRCEEPLGLAADLPRREGTRELLGRLNAVYERWIRAAPEQWAWHQERWRSRPGDVVPRARGGTRVLAAPDAP